MLPNPVFVFPFRVAGTSKWIRTRVLPAPTGSGNLIAEEKLAIRLLPISA